MNILKNNNSNKDINFNKLENLLNFKDTKLLIDKKISNWKFFNFTYENNTIEININKNYEFLSHTKYICDYFNDNEKTLFINLLKPKKFNLFFKNKILNYIHTDLILLINIIHNTDEQQIKNNLIDYLSFYIDRKKLLDYFSDKSINNEKRSNIFTTNKDSIIFSLNNPTCNRLTDKLDKKTINLISKNKLIANIEICNGFDEEKLIEFIKKVNFFCAKVNKLIPSINENQKFSLKIRKIKRTKKKGMYIKLQNTIIVDPRYTNSFIHELGHWYHCHFIPSIKTVEDAESFAENFYKNYIKQK